MTPSNPPDDGSLSGVAVGQYRIQRRIGHGAMGEVYLARDEKLGRAVAVKTVRPEIARDPRHHRLLLREARHALEVSHPYVATLLDVVEHDGAPLLVMEYIEGRELGRALAEDRPDEGTLLRYFVEIAEALAAIHRAGLIHRDLKPSNVLLTREDHVKVTDFGLSGRDPLRGGAAAPDAETQAGTASTESVSEGGIKGTVPYMAPEQLRGRGVDPRSDLFAFGVMLYEALTGVHPFRRDSLAETVSAILNDAPRIGEAASALSTDNPLHRIALRLVAKQPERRYPSAERLLADLRAIQAGSRPEVPLPRSRRRPLLAAATAAAVLLAAAGAARWCRESTRPAVAVLPFETAAGAPAAARGAMVAELVGAYLSETRVARAVAYERVVELDAVGGADESGRDRAGRVGRALSARWVLAGKLYDEGAAVACKVDLYRAGDDDVRDSFVVRETDPLELARKVAARARERIAGPAQPGEAIAEGRFVASTSGEAQQLYLQAREFAERQRFSDALERLDRSITLDPKFVRAIVLQASLLNEIGYELRARRQIDRAGRLAQEVELPAEDRLALELAAARARIYNRAEEAVEHYRRLAERFDDEPATLLQFATVLGQAGRRDEALTVLDQARRLDRDNPRIPLQRALLLADGGRAGEALAALDEAERLRAGLGIPNGRGAITERRAYVAYRRGDFRQAAETYGRAAELYRAEGLALRAMGPLKSQGDMELHLWNLDAAKTKLSEALQAAREAGDVSLAIRTLNSLAATDLRTGTLAEAERHADEALQEALKIENEALQISPLLTLASIYNLTQRLGEARGSAEEARAIAERRDEPAKIAFAWLSLAETHQRGGEFAAAETALDTIGGAERFGGYRLWVAQRRASVGEDAERPGGALEAADEAVRLARESGGAAQIGYSLALRSRILSGIGAFEDAGRDLDEAAPLLAGEQGAQLQRALDLARRRLQAARMEWTALAGETEPDPRQASLELVPLLLLHAEAARALGRPDEAERRAAAALEHPWATASDAATAELALARAREARDRTSSALEAAGAAFERAERLDLSLTASRAAALLAALRDSSAAAEAAASTAAERLEAYLAELPPQRRKLARERLGPG